MSMVDKLYEKYNILPSIIKDSELVKRFFKAAIKKNSQDLRQNL